MSSKVKSLRANYIYRFVSNDERGNSQLNSFIALLIWQQEGEGVATHQILCNWLHII